MNGSMPESDGELVVDLWLGLDFDPDEADKWGAFEERALSEVDARASVAYDEA